MKLLLSTWKQLRTSAYSGDFALVLLAWGLLRYATTMEAMTVAALSLGAGLISASLDLIPDDDE
jgi:hypothetical protein